MPELSVLIDLMYWNSFLGLVWLFAGGWSGSLTGRSQMIVVPICFSLLFLYLCFDLLISITIFNIITFFIQFIFLVYKFSQRVGNLCL